MKTIFAPITSINQNGVCVIRISGKNALECLKHLGINIEKVEHRKSLFSQIKNPKNDNILDECLITYFKAPYSFTGEDVAEISIHSSNYIFKEISNIFNNIADVRIAEPGEFSKRAFLNNKMNLLEAEAIPDLIASETELQHSQALKQISGQVSEIYDDLRDDIINSSAMIEAAIDFPDEDLPQDIIKNINSNISNIINRIENITDDNYSAQKIKNGLNLAIIGQPNVGKSTLINYLAKSEVAIVSNIAGTTRDIVETQLNIAGVAVKISDSAGIRKSTDKIEQEGIKRAVKKAELADIIILVLDANRINITSELQKLINENTIIIINKIDENPNFIKPNLDQESVNISLTQNINLDQLIQKLENKVKSQIPTISSAIITQERHRNCLHKALEFLKEFSLDKEIELAAEDLRLAANEIGKITGKIDVENILDVIFSSFCIGK